MAISLSALCSGASPSSVKLDFAFQLFDMDGSNQPIVSALPSCAGFEIIMHDIVFP